SHIDVEGWFGRTTRGEKAARQEVESSWFVFTDVAQSLATRLNSTEKVGLITAVFYEEAKGRGLGVGSVAGGTTKLEVKSFLRGPMVATISLGYVDARELRQLVQQ